jgi:hypothetical protein
MAYKCGVLSFLFSFLVIGASIGAAEIRPALPINLSLEHDIGPKLSQELPRILRTALNVVQLFPPKGYENNLFNWSADPQILTAKTLNIIYAKTKTPWIAPLLANSNSENMDAFTIAPIDVTNKSMSILVVLLVDKIFFDRNGQEYENGFARLVLALAHEIYGNVQHFLQIGIGDAKPQTMEDRVNLERRAYRASLLFLAGVRDSDNFFNLPSGLRKGLMALLPSEVKAFRSWQRAHPSRALDPACEAILASVKKEL